MSPGPPASPAPSSRSRPRWQRRLTLVRRRRPAVLAIEAGTLLIALAVMLASYRIVMRSDGAERLLSPPSVALLLVANLVPIMALFVLIARRVAQRRAARAAVVGGGRLHVRLVALFSVIAAVPTLLVVIFASLLFQYNVEFWFSEKARTVVENADRVAQAYVEEAKQRIAADALPMAGDVANDLSQLAIDDPRFSANFARQVLYRNLNEAAVLSVGRDNTLRLMAGANLDARPLERRLPLPVLGTIQPDAPRVTTEAGDRVEAVVALDPRTRTFLYVSRAVDPNVLAQVARARSALGDYTSLLDRSRTLQLRFNAMLLLVSLAIVGLAVLVAFAVADRVVRPVGDLVDAARRVAGGDLSARVPVRTARDEVGVLATVFNRMTRRLEEQTGALVRANSQLDQRRAFTEAVLSGVTAGIVSVDRERRIRLMNLSAADVLRVEAAAAVGRPLGQLSPELDHMLGRGEREAVVQMTSGGEARTLAVRAVRVTDGHVLTFDDITQQLLDQRRAAWSDVARRIAHEIKNPLTPIQLAAERLQRRYGKEVTSDPSVFERLTSTIVRQVGDLRRMVDEFSSFARMPKPCFREEAIVDIARQAIFLHEVAHPGIVFRLDAPEPSPLLVCDRRQLGQALTNIVKNAVEAIEAKGEHAQGAVTAAIREDQGKLVIEIADDGIGLPAERERLTEPYMTTRARGTGLGLAIVKKIVEEHFGAIALTDRPGGGTIVRLTFDPATLAPFAGAGEAAQEDQDGEAAARRAVLTRMGTV